VSTDVTGSGLPPLADTRSSGPSLKPLNRMTPSAFQVPPRPWATSQIAVGNPPSTSTRLSFPAAKNPIDRLSGDQKGYVASSVPGMTRGSTASNRLIQSRAGEIRLEL
jgi:hypothetical protein